MFDFLPLKIKYPLSRLKSEDLYEIRLRAGRPVSVRYGMKNFFLSPEGVSAENSRGVTVTEGEIADAILSFCERSVYAYADKIRGGFITLAGGERVGLCGECVIENGKISNIKNISSINIRIPHAVKGCADKITEHFSGGIKNTLIVSPPGSGKTTIVRDIAEKISSEYGANVLVCDERNEIFPLMSSADTVDCIKYGRKKYAFENGIRAMSPDVIVTDEIIGEEDAAAVYTASESGVKVIATAHGSDAKKFLSRGEYAILKGVFDLLVTLDESRGKGTVKEIINRESNGR